ncbi:MAG: hypothetical protein JXA30_18935 [Deltaproteobacteria bacterium]|nr:hypothetical protein [Deltaproteobacteria bacterium]
MARIGSYVLTGFFAISSAALSFCSAEKENGVVALSGGETAATSGSESNAAAGFAGDSLSSGKGNRAASGPGGNATSNEAPDGGSTVRVSKSDAGNCGEVTEKTKNTRTPVDIIFGIDTSGSMSEEVAMVQENMNAFSRQIMDANIDVRVIVLSTLQIGRIPYYDVDGPCIAAPLGSGACPEDSNPPTYVHLDVIVDSFGVLDVYINQYPNYRQYLRENSIKTFVTISDDDADNSTNPFAVALGVPQPSYHSAEAFIDAVNQLEPNSPMWSNWRYSAIYSYTLCPPSQFGAIGVVHGQLVERTGGVGGDLCLQDFQPVFDALATEVVSSTKIACEWVIPAPPSGERLDVDNTAVQFTVNGIKENPLPRILDAAKCENHEAWYYDNPDSPTRVLACPVMCRRVQAAQQAEVTILFGCAPPLVTIL